MAEKWRRPQLINRLSTGALWIMRISKDVQRLLRPGDRGGGGG